MRSEPIVMLVIASEVVVALVVVEFWMETFVSVDEPSPRRPLEKVSVVVVELPVKR